MADPFLSLTLEERREVLESAQGRGLTRSAALLEKDVWVVWTLQALFAAPFADDLVFKGGTSLSKAYNIIQRFSEDVDLTYDIRKLADEQAGHPEALSEAEARSLGRRIRAKLLPRLLEAEIQPYLQAQIADAGLQATVERDGENLFVVYEAAAEYPDYVSPRVKLEFGARSTGEPATRRPIACDLAPAFPELEFPSATPRVMRAERTFWEKAALAHVYCLEGKLRGATGFARHWHDLSRLDEAGVAAAAMADRALATAVADHKAKFFPAKDAHAAPVDYHAAVSGHLRLVPGGEAFDLLKADYAAMIEAGYLEGDAEAFEALMARCGDLQVRINAAA
ncbi:MAG TPA: nucleotidyl transferase AbiEii/AbiGii toxin family protein [Caulobacteraceae bacterium]|nr:nucleotidyl transferase AbiEii/AbiGii toxin family protein [Caulobacteraceae bacterium]